MNQQLAYQWLIDNDRFVYYNLKFQPGELQTFFDVYNAITGDKKTKTACSRCLLAMKHRLQVELKTIKSMNTYPVYRTQRGNLTLTQPKDATVVFQIRAKGDEAAKVALQNLKTIEQTQSKKIDQ